VLYAGLHDGPEIHQTILEKGHCTQEVFNRRKDGQDHDTDAHLDYSILRRVFHGPYETKVSRKSQFLINLGIGTRTHPGVICENRLS
jgi:hypothetical protein